MLDSAQSKPAAQPSWYAWQTYLPKKARGVLQANSSKDAKQQLSIQGLGSVRIKALPKGAKGKLATAYFWKNWLSRWLPLIASGFDLHKSLQLMLQQSLTIQEAELAHLLLSALNQGQPIHPVFRNCTPSLPLPCLQLLTFAEHSGQLDQSLQQLELYFSQVLKRAAYLKQALSYPLVILSGAVLLILLLAFFILPTFAQFYQESGATLPKLTQLILQPSQFISWQKMLGSLLVGLGIILLALVCYPILFSQPQLRHLLNRYSFWFTWVERPKLQQEIHLLASALNQGMTLQQGILLIAHAHSCPWRQQLWYKALYYLQRGEASLQVFAPLSFSMEEESLVAIGEQSGTLARSLEQIAIRQYHHTQKQQQRLLRVIPGLALGLTSLLVGAILLALYLPLFQLGAQVI